MRTALAGLLVSGTVAAAVVATMSWTAPGQPMQTRSAPLASTTASAGRQQVASRTVHAHAIRAAATGSSRNASGLPAIEPVDDTASSPFVNAGGQFDPEAVPAVLKSVEAGKAEARVESVEAGDTPAPADTLADASDAAASPAETSPDAGGGATATGPLPSPVAEAGPVLPATRATPDALPDSLPGAGGDGGDTPADAPAMVAAGPAPGVSPGAGGGFPASPTGSPSIGGGTPSPAPSGGSPAASAPGAGSPSPDSGTPAAPAAPQPIIVDSGPFKGFGPYSEPLIVVDGGILAPGASPGIMQLSDFELDGGVLEIEIWGPALGTESDLLAITGVANFVSGTIRFIFSDDQGGIYVPEVGDQFVFLAAAGGILGFDGNDLLSLISVDLDDSLSFTVLNNGSMLTLEILAADIPETATAGDVAVASVGAPPMLAAIALSLAVTGFAGIARRRRAPPPPAGGG